MKFDDIIKLIKQEAVDGPIYDTTPIERLSPIESIPLKNKTYECNGKIVASVDDIGNAVLYLKHELSVLTSKLINKDVPAGQQMVMFNLMLLVRSYIDNAFSDVKTGKMFFDLDLDITD